MKMVIIARWEFRSASDRCLSELLRTARAPNDKLELLLRRLLLHRFLRRLVENRYDFQETFTLKEMRQHMLFHLLLIPKLKSQAKNLRSMHWICTTLKSL